MAPPPASLPAFVPQDFAAYEEPRQTDPDYNGYRLIVRRKLDAHGKAAQRHLKRAKGLGLACRTSLNHPHPSNRRRVRSQIAYLSRLPEDKKELRALVGPALGEDVDTGYIQTTLAIQVDAAGFEQSLRIHAQAWWDGQNLVHRVRDPAEMDLFGDLVNGLPRGFVLYMDSWRKEYVAGRISPQELARYFARYEPGRHWFNLRRRLDQRTAVELGTGIAGFVEEGLGALADLYRFICWAPGNDRLFDAGGRIRS